MTIKSPLWLENLEYSATDMRRLVTALFPLDGCIEDGDLKVTQHGAGAMSVDVAVGSAVIAGTAVSGQGSYLFGSDATVTATISGAPGSGQSRIDAIVAQIQDQDADGGSDNDGIIAVVTGTAASTGSEVAPSLPASSIVLAHVLVGPSVTTILTANITDFRNFAHDKDTSIGDAKMILGPNLPGAGWEWVDGTDVNRAAYARYMAAVGTVWGAGDGTTTVAKPDLQNFFPVGAGDTYDLAASGGEATHTLDTAEIPADLPVTDGGHEHPAYIGEVGTGAQLVYTDDTEVGNVYAIPVTGGAGGSPLLVANDDAVHVQVAETGITVGGSGDAHNNLPPYKGVNFAICMR